jgi:hypothetical protein
MPERCTVCVPALVDRAIARSGLALETPDRFRLIAALLGRRHLIISGKNNAALGSLVGMLGEELAGRREDYLCKLPGHPWWAAGTERCGYYAEMQENVGIWRLSYFLADALPGQPDTDCSLRRVVCIQNMSLAEVEYYYEFLARQLARVPELTQIRVALLGAYTAETPPALSPIAQRWTSVVHVGPT